MLERLSLFLLALALTGCGDVLREDESADSEYQVQPLDRTAVIGERPVRVGYDGPRFNACASNAQIINLNPRGDNYLSVLAAPADSASEVDRLDPGARVSVCQKVGGWLGIVYPTEDQALEDCGTGSPVSSVREYDGACRSGWISDNYVKLISG